MPGPRPVFLAVLALGALCLFGPGCRKSTPGPAGGPGDPDGGEAPRVVAKATTKSMASFGSEAELTGFLKELAEAQKRDSARMRREASSGDLAGVSARGRTRTR